jgi:anti-sigma regulatory factor (Ser/Thr protein kinase)
MRNTWLAPCHSSGDGLAAGEPVAVAVPGPNLELIRHTYNTELLDPVWIEDAYKTHPLMWDAAGRFDSVHYDDPAVVAASFNRPLPGPPADAATITVDVYTLPAIRRFVAAHAHRAGLAPERVADLTIAVSELAGNAIEHGGGTGEIAIWAEEHQLLCQLVDSGYLSHPLAGRIPVPADAPTGGRGLLLDNQLCDLVRVHATPAGTTTRIYLHRK